jgi:beta-galactosidase
MRAIDAKGRPVPTANLAVDFELVGPGAIIGLGNGNPNSHEPEKGNRRSLFNGLAQVILQSRPGGSGPMTLRASAPGLQPASATIAVTAAPEIPSVAAAAPSLQLRQWRMSSASATKPDPCAQVADNDMNTWTNVTPGRLEKFGGGAWAVFRSEKFKPFESQRKNGGCIVFKSITGKAEIWIDRNLVATKTDCQAAPVTVPLPAGEGDRILNVLVETTPGQPAGLGGSVEVQAR